MKLFAFFPIFFLTIGCTGPEDLRSIETGQRGTWEGTPKKWELVHSESETRAIAAFRLEQRPKKIRISEGELTAKDIDLVFNFPLAVCRLEHGSVCAIPASEFEFLNRPFKVRGSIRANSPRSPERLNGSPDFEMTILHIPFEQRSSWASGPFVLILSDKELRKLGWKGPIATSWNEPSTQPSD